MARQIKAIDGMSRLPKLRDQTALAGGTAFENRNEKPIPELPPLASAFGEDLRSEEVALIQRRLGGRQSDLFLSQRILGWMENDIPNASLPEAVTYDWLKLAGKRFVYQYHYGGGRSVKGGLVPDFLVDVGGEWSVWNVQGEYWHSGAINGNKDQSFRYELMGALIMGMTVKFVIELWENDIYNSRPRIFQSAESGRGLRE